MKTAQFNRMPLLLAGLVGLLVTTSAHANSGIPVFNMLQGQMDAVNPLRWTLACMTMCVGIESVIYKYAGFLRRPFVMSLVSNTASYIAGYPLAMGAALLMYAFGAYHGLILIFIMIMPTLFSIGIEGVIVMKNVRDEHRSHRRRNWSVVIGANVLTNILMLVYYAIGQWKADV